MQAHLVTRIEDIPLPEAAWNRLVSDNPTNTIFQTYQWFHTWWEIHGSDHQLFFVYVDDESGIIGFAPFMLDGKRRRMTLCFSADTNSDYNDIIAPANRAQIIELILTLIIDRPENIKKFRFMNIPETSDTGEIIRGIFRAHDMKNIYVTSTQTPTLIMHGATPSPRDILKKYSVRRPFNYFSKAGIVAYRYVVDKNEGERLLDLFFEQHIKRCSIATYGSLFKKEKNRLFYKALFFKLLPVGWVLFSVLELNGNPIAFHYGFDYQSKLIWYKPSFDINYQNHSPGILLMRFLILHALDTGRSELDLTIGNEPFKARFSNFTRHNENMYVFKYRHDYVLSELKRLFCLAIKIIAHAIRPKKPNLTE